MRPSPLPTAFPALGHDISTTFRTHPEDLSAQKVNLFAPRKRKLRAPGMTIIYERANLPSTKIEMDFGIVAAVVMIIVWAVITFTGDAPGYVHLLLTIGFFVLFWRVIVRKDPIPPRKS